MNAKYVSNPALKVNWMSAYPTPETHPEMLPQASLETIGLSKASPLPWKVWTSGDKVSIVEVKNPLEVCAVTLYKNGRERANAHLIVKAVNEHAALVAVAEVSDELQGYFAGGETQYFAGCVAKLRVALANLAAVRKQSPTTS